MPGMLPATRALIPGALLALLLAAHVGHAQNLVAPAAMSEDAAVAMVRERTGGKVVRVQSRTDTGSLVYHIRVLTPDGRLREYRVDAATGSVR